MLENPDNKLTMSFLEYKSSCSTFYSYRGQNHMHCSAVIIKLWILQPTTAWIWNNRVKDEPTRNELQFWRCKWLVRLQHEKVIKMLYCESSDGSWNAGVVGHYDQYNSKKTNCVRVMTNHVTHFLRTLRVCTNSPIVIVSLCTFPPEQESERLIYDNKTHPFLSCTSNIRQNQQNPRNKNKHYT